MGIQALIDTQVLTVAGSTGDVMTVQADGSYLAETPAGGGVGGSTGAVDNAVLRADGVGGVTLQTSAFTIADLATGSPNNTVNNVSMAPTGGTTNVSVSIVPKGTGSFSLAVPDGTATGGNARGANSVDLQTARSAAANVASGSYSFACGYDNRASGSYSFSSGYQSIASSVNGVAIGWQCTASGSYETFAFGEYCIASANNALAIGHQVQSSAVAASAWGSRASSTRYGMYSHAAGYFAAMGDAQSARFVLRKKTTDATPTTLMLDGSTTRLTIPSGKTMSANIIISGIKSDGSAKCTFWRKVVITNVGGTTTLDAEIKEHDAKDVASCDVTITADDTNDALQIDVTGVAAETWRWVAVVEGLEIGYGV